MGSIHEYDKFTDLLLWVLALFVIVLLGIGIANQNANQNMARYIAEKTATILANHTIKPLYNIQSQSTKMHWTYIKLGLIGESDDDKILAEIDKKILEFEAKNKCKIISSDLDKDQDSPGIKAIVRGIRVFW